MDKTNWNYIDIWSKKIRAIKYLGGKCSKCGEDNIFVLTFHHINPDEKDYCISNIKNRRWSIIEKELDKCILLCENCHREEHYYQINNRNQINKKIYLEYKNIYKCSKCGYDKLKHSLEFHHKDNEKNFNLSSLSKRLKTISDLEDYIKEELDKCEVLCANCHREEHTDKIRFDKYKDLIYNKEINEYLKPIKPEVIKEMLDSGMKQIEIARQLGRNKSTIGTIVKKHNLYTSIA